jgi:hypothetical protein
MPEPSVLLVGDLHGNANALQRAFLQAHYAGASAIIQLGDFGFGWRLDDGKCAFTSLVADFVRQSEIRFHFLDGNHENFDLLYAIPKDENGHREVAPGVFHLHRGSKLSIGSTTFLAMGGAYSVDKPNRREGVSWWPQEAITDEDVERALAAGQVDVLLSHDIPRGIQDEEKVAPYLDRIFGTGAAENAFVGQTLLRQVLDACGAQRAFHGHLHYFHETWLGAQGEGVLVVGLNKEDEPDSTILLEC